MLHLHGRGVEDVLPIHVADPHSPHRAVKGDVGDFSLRVRYDKSQMAQHDALTAKVTIRGDGYLRSVDAPELKLPSGFDQFDPTVDESISMSGEMMKGRKDFTYLIIPRRAGTFNLDPVSFSFFNPATKRYETVEDRGTEIYVSPADGSVGEGDWIEKSDVALLDSDIRFIKELASPLVATTTPVYSTVWFYLLLGASPFLFLLGLGTEQIIVHRLSDQTALRRRRAPEKMRKEIKNAIRIAKGGEFGRAIEIAGKALSEMVGALTATPAAGLTSDLVRENLPALGAEPDLIEEVTELIQEADRIKFSGGKLDADISNELIVRYKTAGRRLEKLR